MPGKDVLVLNAGIPAAGARDCLDRYIQSEHKFDPDVVVIHVGRNDALTLFGHQHFQNDAPAVRIRENPRQYEVALLNGRITGPVLKYPYALWLDNSTEVIRIEERLKRAVEAKRKNVLEAKRNTAAEPRPYPQTFHKNVEALAVLAKHDGSQVVLFPVPMNPYLDTTDPVYAIQDDIRLTTLVDTHAALKNVAGTQQLSHVEIDPRSIPEAAYKDDCHVFVEEHRINARRLAEHLLKGGRAEGLDDK